MMSNIGCRDASLPSNDFFRCKRCKRQQRHYMTTFADNELLSGAFGFRVVHDIDRFQVEHQTSMTGTARTCRNSFVQSKHSSAQKR